MGSNLNMVFIHRMTPSMRMHNKYRRPVLSDIFSWLHIFNISTNYQKLQANYMVYKQCWPQATIIFQCSTVTFYKNLSILDHHKRNAFQRNATTMRWARIKCYQHS